MGVQDWLWLTDGEWRQERVDLQVASGGLIARDFFWLAEMGIELGVKGSTAAGDQLVELDYPVQSCLSDVSGAGHADGGATQESIPASATPEPGSPPKSTEARTRVPADNLAAEDAEGARLKAEEEAEVAKNVAEESKTKLAAEEASAAKVSADKLAAEEAEAPWSTRAAAVNTVRPLGVVVHQAFVAVERAFSVYSSTMRGESPPVTSFLAAQHSTAGLISPATRTLHEGAVGNEPCVEDDVAMAAQSARKLLRLVEDTRHLYSQA
jgi:hypothetical protein